MARAGRAGVAAAAASLAGLAAPGHCLAVAVADGRTGLSLAAAADVSANPIRKVVTLLQKLVKSTEEEGKKEEDLYEKFACFCKNNGGELAKTIAESTAKVPAVQGDIQELESETQRLEQDLVDHQADRSAAKSAIDAAVAQREIEFKEFSGVSGEYKGYLAALGDAIPAISNAMAGGALLQEQAGLQMKQLRRAVSAASGITDYDRQMVSGFLQGRVSDGDGYVPKSGEIVGILRTIETDFQKNLDEVTEAEKKQVAVHEDLMAAKNKQVQTLSASVERKIQRSGNAKVEIANMKADMTQTEAALIADQKLSAELESNCGSKATEMEARKKLRAEELVALHDTIKILNQDDALELFKNTLSLVQLSVGRKGAGMEALRALQAVPKGRPAMDLLAMALSGKKVDFAKVHKMIDDMVGLLKQEQADDDHKVDYCRGQLQAVAAKITAATKKAEDLASSAEEAGEAIATLASEVTELQKGIADLDRSVEDEGIMRQEQNRAFENLRAQNSAAKELLQTAKHRLLKFYNPALATEAPTVAVSEDERIANNIASQLDASPALVQVAMHSAFRSKARAPPTWKGDYQTQSQGSQGVVVLVERLIKDLDLEVTEAETDEKHAQQEYEEFTMDAAVKRAADVKSVATKNKSKADFEESKVAAETEHKTKAKEMLVTSRIKAGLHQECDWLTNNFDLRKVARADEVDSLTKAKAILSGADFSLVQGHSAGVGGRAGKGQVLRGSR